MKPPIEPPVTRDKVRELTKRWAYEPSTVGEYLHEGFNSDPVSGGFAFSCDRGLVIASTGGSCIWSGITGDVAAQHDAIDEFWRKQRHKDRPLAIDQVSVWHRAAIGALVQGLPSVADLPEHEREALPDLPRAEGLLIVLRGTLRRVESAPTEAAALRILAADDWLLNTPSEALAAHPCPLCQRLALGSSVGRVEVCDRCARHARCCDNRLVAGSNTSLFGGFIAVHVDDKTPCDQVTRNGIVYIDNKVCCMGEERIGGVYVAYET